MILEIDKFSVPPECLEILQLFIDKHQIIMKSQPLKDDDKKYMINCNGHDLTFISLNSHITKDNMFPYALCIVSTWCHGLFRSCYAWHKTDHLVDKETFYLYSNINRQVIKMCKADPMIYGEFLKCGEMINAYFNEILGLP